MISLMFYFIERNYDDEAREKFRYTLENIEPRRHLKAVKNPSDKPKFVPAGDEGVEKFRAPAGWTPPGWNEEKSFEASKQFMGWKSNPK